MLCIRTCFCPARARRRHPSAPLVGGTGSTAAPVRTRVATRQARPGPRSWGSDCRCRKLGRPGNPGALGSGVVGGGCAWAFPPRCPLRVDPIPGVPLVGSGLCGVWWKGGGGTKIVGAWVMGGKKHTSTSQAWSLITGEERGSSALPCAHLLTRKEAKRVHSLDSLSGRERPSV